MTPYGGTSHISHLTSKVTLGVETSDVTCYSVVLVAKSCLALLDPMDCSRQAPLSMGFPRQEYWSGLPFPLPGDLPDPGIKPRSSALQADTLPSEPPGKPLTASVSLFLFCK